MSKRLIPPSPEECEYRAYAKRSKRDGTPEFWRRAAEIWRVTSSRRWLRKALARGRRGHHVTITLGNAAKVAKRLPDCIDVDQLGGHADSYWCNRCGRNTPSPGEKCNPGSRHSGMTESPAQRRMWHGARANRLDLYIPDESDNICGYEVGSGVRCASRQASRGRCIIAL